MTRKITTVAILSAALLGSPSVFANDVPLDTGMAPSYPERPVPQPGTHRTVVLQMFGAPAIKLSDASNGSDIWDYGTFRVFFVNDEVEFARVW